MKKAVIYEPWAHGEAHAEFNKAFLQTLSFLYDELYFFGEAEHCTFLKQHDYNRSIQFHSIKITDYESLKGKCFSLFREFKNIKYIKKIAVGADIFFSYGATHSMLIAETLLRDKPVFYVQHGQIELLTKRLSCLNLNHYLPLALKKLPEKHRIIVLGDFIKSNLEKIVPELAGKVLSIDHPFIKTVASISLSEKRKGSVIRVGTIGVGTKDKGIEQLNDIALYARRHDENIQFYHIGRIYDDVSINESLVNLPIKSNGLIPRELFLQNISELDYVLFLYPKNSYKLTASGAIFDALLLGKPIVAIKNDYFEYLFSKNPNIGILCEDIEILKQKVCSLPPVDSEAFKFFSQQSFITLEYFSPKNVAKELKSQLGATSC